MKVQSRQLRHSNIGNSQPVHASCQRPKARSPWEVVGNAEAAALAHMRTYAFLNRQLRGYEDDDFQPRYRMPFALMGRRQR
jgi:hypothetical protein